MSEVVKMERRNLYETKTRHDLWNCYDHYLECCFYDCFKKLGRHWNRSPFWCVFWYQCQSGYRTYEKQDTSRTRKTGETKTRVGIARELMPVLQYSNWQNFEKIISKSKTSCENSDISAFEHFIDVNKTIKMPKEAINGKIK